MKIIPIKNFLGKPLQLKTGNVYYEKELDEAIQKYEAQFQSVNELNKSDVNGMFCRRCYNIRTTHQSGKCEQCFVASGNL